MNEARKEKSVVLVGAGHANLYLAARAEQYRRRGWRLILVDPGRFWYSGLATGMLGGMYSPEADQLDAQRLIESGGGEFVKDTVVSADVVARRLTLASGAQLSYDYVCFNVGSRADTDAVPGAQNHPKVWPVKPVDVLWHLRRHLEQCFAEGKSPQIAVVGGGSSGCELAANLLALGQRCGQLVHLTLVSRSPRLLVRAPSGASRYLHRRLNAMGARVLTSSPVSMTGRGLHLEGAGPVDAPIHADIVVLATGLVANPLMRQIELPAHATAGLSVNNRLHSPRNERVFAAGDCADLMGHRLPKLGVYSVRQASIIHHNILASIDGKKLADFRPQKRYLSILNLGDGTALATWSSFWWNGRASMWLKDRLDRRFLEQYRRRYAP